MLPISLIIPIKNESNSLPKLIDSIEKQTFQPDEVILVDGGSTDNTVEIAERLALEYPRLKIIETSKATPGKGRNIGVEDARNEWIAFTDAGIRLENSWLEGLSNVIEANPQLEIVYGNFSPITETLFEKCATLAYVPPLLNENTIRGKSIASSLLKKRVWKKIGGFLDLRAAEDLIFMERVEEEGFKASFAPKAMVYWQLRPDLISTFNKFVLYSKYNVWADRQWDWHYGVLRQYLLLLPFLVLAIFHSWWWLMVAVLWLFARTTKRIVRHRYELGWQMLLNPIIWLGVAFLIFVIDSATFIGWVQAKLQKKN